MVPSIDRRWFLQGLTASILTAPLATEAQQKGKVWRIGLLYLGSKVEATRWLQPFLEGLGQLGYGEGKNVRVEFWVADGHPENLPTLAAELVQAKPDVIVVNNAGQVAIVQRLTKTLPIVALHAGELVANGVVASLAKPGGNVTGMQLFSGELMGKRLQILKEAVPNLRRLAVLRNPIQWAPRGFALWQQVTDEPAAKLGIRARYVGFDDPAELPGLFAEMAKERDDALLVWSTPNIALHFERIAELAIRNRLPTMHEFAYDLRKGGLMAYGPNLADVRRQAAIYVARIFQGAKPGDLPIGQPTKFELVINLQTAKELGLSIPPSLLARADQVIE